MERKYSLVTITPVLSPRLQLKPERLREGFNQVTKGVERKLASLAHIYPSASSPPGRQAQRHPTHAR